MKKKNNITATFLLPLIAYAILKMHRLKIARLFKQANFRKKEKKQFHLHI